MLSVDFTQNLKRLRETTVLDVWPTRSIVWVAPNCTIGDALQILKDKKIVAVPVIDPMSNRYFGVVDILDIATFIVANFPPVDQITSQMLGELQAGGKNFSRGSTVSQAMAFGKRWSPPNLPSFPFRLNSPIEELIRVFSVGIHRVPVMDNTGKVANFISQMDLLRFLAENIYLLAEGRRGERTLSDLKLVPREVRFVRGDIMVLLALQYMLNDRLSALPVLGKDGRLMANLSASDLKGLGPSDFHHLLRPTSEFLAAFNPKSLYPLTCKATDTLEYVVLKFAATRIHRLWVIDDDQRLVGVLSLTDVMRPFLGMEPMDIDTQAQFFYQ